MAIAMAATRFLVHHAAMVLDEGQDGALEVSEAKAFAGTTLWRVGTEAHQIHGGVGFVLDHALHLYFAQARGADTLFGSVRPHFEKVGGAILDGGRFTPNALLGVA
jgi:alkylation response protein AidB-like acyl-CoA dehydrogenase